jgi:hypothetical protein
VKRFTRSMAFTQHNKILGLTVGELEDWQWDLVSRRRSRVEPLPRRQQPQPVTLPKPPPILGGWKQRVGVVLEILRHPARWLSLPPAGTAVDDLLSVRACFEVDEAQVRPNDESAARFAARVSGEQRRDQLVDEVLAFTRSIDKQVRDLRERSILWSAQQMSEKIDA